VAVKLTQVTKQQQSREMRRGWCQPPAGTSPIGAALAGASLAKPQLAVM